MSSCKTRDFPEPKKTGEEETLSYGYYSKLLNRPFDTLDALKEAEEEVRKENERKAQLVEVKKARAKEVEDAYLEYQKVKEEAYKQIAEAEKKWIELRDKFAKDYNGYHMTYVNNNGQKQITFSDMVNSFFNW